MSVKEDQSWAKEQAAKSHAGIDAAQAASDKAVDYIADLAQNMGDVNYRVMAASRAPFELGVALTFMDMVVPMVESMRKRLKKKGGLNNAEIDILTNTYLSIFVKEVSEAIQNETNPRT